MLLTHSSLVLPLPRRVEQWSGGPVLCADLLASAADVWARSKTVAGILPPLTRQIYIPLFMQLINSAKCHFAVGKLLHIFVK